MTVHTLSLTEAGRQLRRRAISPVELTQAALARIAATDGAINAFSELLAEEALAQARQADKDIAGGLDRGPLHGIPISIKDIFDVAGHVTVADSKALPSVAAGRDAAVVKNLRDGGAVILGKTHVHECAYGCTTPSTKNPWNTAHVPGGSSGGSAASIAAGQAWFSVGSDTGGSIRAPSSHCGVVGFKPSYDLVSRTGGLTLSWSLDHVGPMARSVSDVALGLKAMIGGAGAGFEPDRSFRLGDVRIGIPSNYYFDDIEPKLHGRVRNAIDALGGAGAALEEVEVPYAPQLLATHFCIMFSEASAFHRTAIQERAEAFGDDVRTWLRIGCLVPATDYLQAQRTRKLIADAWDRMFQNIDVLVAPVVAAPASKIGALAWTKPDGSEESILSAYSRLAAPANLLGLPAVSLPCGFVDGLPVGLQIIGRRGDDAKVLSIARAYEMTQTFEGQIAPN